MVYEVGNVLICKSKVHTGCLQATNPSFEIEVGDRFVITDEEYYPDNDCHWYELTSEDESIVLDAWNDRGHMILDEKFKLV